jgi:hypothetical protein
MRLPRRIRDEEQRACRVEGGLRIDAPQRVGEGDQVLEAELLAVPAPAG